MATTATAILTDGTTFVLAHVGDSRAYRYRVGRLTQVTRDDSLLEEFCSTPARSDLRMRGRIRIATSSRKRLVKMRRSNSWWRH